MRVDFRETELKMTSDPRLRAGVRAALEHICERDGLGKDERRELAAAVENECTNVLESQRETTCAVTIDELQDRIEVSVGPATGLNAGESNPRQSNAASAAGSKFHAEARSSTSRAQHTAGGNGRAPATIVRHFHRNPAHS
jgi:uncharacterized protein with PIN domain